MFRKHCFRYMIRPTFDEIVVLAFSVIVLMTSSAMATAAEDQLLCLSQTLCANCTVNWQCGWCSSLSKCVRSDVFGPIEASDCPNGVDDIRYKQCSESKYLALYLVLGLGLPAIFGGIAFYLHRKKSLAKQNKAAQKAQFGVGMGKIGDKYKKYLRGKDEGLLSADAVSQNYNDREGRGGAGSSKKSNNIFGAFRK